MSELVMLATLVVLFIFAAFVLGALWFQSLPQSHRLTDWSQHAQAIARAEMLLQEVLTETELQNLARNGYLDVPSPTNPSRVYRVPRRRGRITVYQDGVPEASLCVQSTTSVPDADLVLTHKLLIEADEEHYLAVANRFRVPGSGFGAW